ncbi:1,3-beta-glucanosyltransferase gas1 [Ceratobasidium sp. UAMH 11750]|nr:1,3-beta-glucanosyltransferase gas1 [Ceratobasidium sp. UAMH 11750]
MKLLALAALAHTALALPSITRTGRYLYTPDGNRFYIKGISYQEQGTLAVTDDPNAFPEPDNFVDPLAIPAACKRDIPYLQQLTVNAVRVYSVNSSLNHDECMSAFDAAGIYTIIDLALPVNGSLDRASPAWTTNLLDLYIGTIDAFSKYSNVLAFNVGNEVVTMTNNTVAAPPPRLWTEATALFSSQMTPVWSGGIAFSYFFAVGGYGMVNISADNTTVTVSDDFNRLKNVLSTITTVNEPVQSSAGPSSYSSCPSANTSFLASSTLPPTPNLAACDCIVKNSLSCLFTPTTPQGVNGVGQLLDLGCQLLGQNGGSCDAIAGNGQTGTYGPLSGCDPNTKLSYVFSQYYERTARNPQSCSFGGNATLASPLPSNSAAAASAQASCLSANPTGVVTPTAPATASATATGRGGSGGSGGSNNNGAVGIGAGAMVGTVGVVALGVVSGVWMLF